MSFEALSRTYLRNLQESIIEAIRTGEFTEELSYRPTLHAYFLDLMAFFNPEIRAVYEPRRQARAGHPDWRFYNSHTLGVYGYAEAKGVHPRNPINISGYQSQINRYLELGYDLIVTDGIEFIFFTAEDGEFNRICLVDKPVVSSDWSSLRPQFQIETEFRRFFSIESFRRCTEEQLIEEVAKRAKQLACNISELADLPLGAGLDEQENQTIETLHNLRPLLEEHHDVRLRNIKSFSDFIAQVLVFGLFYAHRVVRSGDETPADLLIKINSFWESTAYEAYTDKLRPFRGLLELLAEELDCLGVLGTWYQDCCLLLAHVRLDDVQFVTPDYHKLYEKFLEVYDPDARFDYGVFYTPRQLAKFAVNLTTAITEAEFDGQSLFETGNKLIDPCCGTGTFIEQLIIRGGLLASHPFIIGFEILPAPYALAHYRICMLGDNNGIPENLSILLTNTLCDELEDMNGPEPDNLIAAEQAIAKRYARPPLTLVIGNPPSSDSGNKIDAPNQSIIEELLEDFRPERSERSDRQNLLKQTKNEFMKFLRWSIKKLETSNPGILTFILPSSFIDRPSYYWARKKILYQFKKVWILELDEDGRTGVRSSSLFNTQQGRVLLIGITDASHSTGELGSVFYSSIKELNKEEKLRYLESDWDPSGLFEEFENIDIDHTSYVLRRVPEIDLELYSLFWPLYPEGREPREGEKYIFERHCSGVKLAPSAMFVHPDNNVLMRRCRDIADRAIDYQELMSRWFSGQDKLPRPSKLTDDIRIKIGEAMRLPEVPIQKYSYRPFVDLHVLLYEPVMHILSQTGGGGTRLRPEVVSAFRNDETIGISVAPAPKDIGESLHRFASFCWHVGDNDLCRRGNGHIFCNLFPSYRISRRDSGDEGWDPTPRMNINPDLLNRLSIIVNRTQEETAKLIVFYIYAVLCSNSFLDEFESALFSVADRNQRPRLPFPDDRNIFLQISEMGKELAQLEDATWPITLSEEWSRHLSVYDSEFELKSYKIDLEAERIELTDGNRIKISIHPINPFILSFKVSGYDVVKQWLKFHSFRYTRKTFTYQDYNALLSLLQRIAKQSEIIACLDMEMQKILTRQFNFI